MCRIVSECRLNHYLDKLIINIFLYIKQAITSHDINILKYKTIFNIKNDMERRKDAFQGDFVVVDL